MLIQKEEFYSFKDFCRDYFKKNRHGRSVNVLERLKKDDRELYRTIEKAVGKQKIKGYIGRLLRSISREGWLIYEKKEWRTKPEWGYCTYCFKELDDVYLIDIEQHQYCSSSCFDEHEAVPHYDGYADDYFFLFWDFEKLKDEYEIFLNKPIKNDYLTHTRLTMVLRDLYNILDDSDYSAVLFNGGDDGPLASEMYRMMITLKTDAEQLERLLEQCKDVLPPTNQLYSIEISEEIMRKRKRPEVLRQFVNDNRKYRNKDNKNKWSTSDSFQRLEWYDTLTKDETLKDRVAWINEIECPLCEQVVGSDESRRVPDGYFYCEECYEQLDLQYNFRRG
ncbi:hypothetical protein ACLIA0_13760 [Bacillaceae bacterium W0354]